MKRLRPLEWVLLGFVLIVVLFAGPRALLLAFDDVNTSRARRVLIALMVIATIRLWRHYRSTAWPSDSDDARKKLFLALPLALFPLAAVWIRNPLLTELTAATDIRAVMAVLLTLVLQVLGLAAVPLAIWLAVGLHLKTGAPFLKTSARGLATAAREWLPIVFLISGYAWMGRVMNLSTIESLDPTMASIDRALFFGGDPLEWLQRLIVAPLSEWLAFSYSFYAVLFPLCLGAVYLQAGERGLRPSLFAVGTAMVIAYLSYALIPVKGPVFARTFDVPLELYLVGTVKEAMMDSTRITFDCFPSLHTAATLLLWWSCWRFSRRVFWVIAPMAASIPFACVYLRYHYVIDVLAGIALAAAMVPLTLKLFPTPSAQAE